MSGHFWRARRGGLRWEGIPTRERRVEGNPASGDPNPEDALLRLDGVEAVRRVVDALPEELRHVLVLTGVEGLNSREIAEVVGIPEGTVRTRLQRARQLVKQKLESMGRSACGK